MYQGKNGTPRAGLDETANGVMEHSFIVPNAAT
jgi:hypothetical protein